MKQLSKTISRLPESGIRKLQEAARYIPGAYRLETGEPSFKTPKHICEFALNAHARFFGHGRPICALNTLKRASNGAGKRMPARAC